MRCDKRFVVCVVFRVIDESRKRANDSRIQIRLKSNAGFKINEKNAVPPDNQIERGYKLPSFLENNTSDTKSNSEEDLSGCTGCGLRLYILLPSSFFLSLAVVGFAAPNSTPLTGFALIATCTASIVAIGYFLNESPMAFGIYVVSVVIAAFIGFGALVGKMLFDSPITGSLIVLAVLTLILLRYWYKNIR